MNTSQTCKSDYYFTGTIDNKEMCNFKYALASHLKQGYIGIM